MTRRVLASVFFAAAAFVLLAKAEPPTPPAKTDGKPKVEKENLDVKATVGELTAKQVRMQALFSDFKGALLRLSQRMAASPKPEDQERAKLLKQALEKANEEGIDNSFDKLITILKAADKEDQAAIEKAMGETDDAEKWGPANLLLTSAARSPGRAVGRLARYNRHNPHHGPDS